MDFRERLRQAMDEKDSLLCVGLDPQPERTRPEDILSFNTKIIEETADFVCAYKPQSAFYEVAGDIGWKALRETVEVIRDKAPHAVVILDAKRGDVFNTAEACASALFEWFSADAATVNPYMGRDSALPFLNWGARGKGVFFLCRTSNPGSSEFQELAVQGADGHRRSLFIEIAGHVERWGRDNADCAGLVVGATYPNDVGRVRDECPSVPILLPGVGKQGGDLRESVFRGVDGSGRGLLVSSSRSIIYSDEIAGTARAMRDAINAARTIDQNSMSDKPPDLAVSVS